MSHPEHDTPPVGEEIHLPGPTLLPLLSAVCITLIVVGTTINPLISIVGLIVFLVTTVCGSATPGVTSRSSRRSTTTSGRRAAARAGVSPAAGRRGTSQAAPAPVHTRTMSRIEMIPTSSEPSTTTRWRNPPRTIVSAACSSDQSVSAKVRLAVRCSATRSASGSCPCATECENVALGDHARPGCIRVHDDRRSDAACPTSPGQHPAGCGRVRRSALLRSSPLKPACFLRMRLQRLSQS